MSDVCLVHLPYAPLEHPSIAMGLLKAALQDTEISVDVVYGNMRFAAEAGFDAYRSIEMEPTVHLVGEWTFAGCLFPDADIDHEEYLDLVLGASPLRREVYYQVREAAKGFIDRLAADILATQPRIVGCSSTFEQHCPSLALLQRIRQLSPDTLTLMGGANCEAEMGVATLKNFPWVDFVVSGEADLLFYDLCRLMLDDGREVDVAKLPYGALGQGHLQIGASRPKPYPPRNSVGDMDAVPVPDYDDYFAALKTSGLGDLIDPGLLAETSRGCWWGATSHCTFCGLNGGNMGYRSKSPERVIGEFKELSERYGIRRFGIVDNILDMSHIQTVLPSLAAADDPYSIFYETKANLKKQHLERLVEAGVRWIQPGIESLHTSVLKLISKGNSAIMNVQLLKWSRELGMRVSWNMLWGFPGEESEWYHDMAQWVPQIAHLQPPHGLGRIRYDRFSPYHVRADEYDIELTPYKTYAYVYDLPHQALMELAYFFDDADQSRWASVEADQNAGHKQLRRWIEQWKEAFFLSGEPPVLSMTEDNGRLTVIDSRPTSTAQRHVLEGLDALVIKCCDSAQTPTSLIRALKAEGHDVTWEHLEPHVQALKDQQLLLQIDDKHLSLPVIGTPPALPRVREFPAGFARPSDPRKFARLAPSAERNVAGG